LSSSSRPLESRTPRRKQRKSEYHLSWKGFEEQRDQLYRAAQEVFASDDAYRPVSSSSVEATAHIIEAIKDPHYGVSNALLRRAADAQQVVHLLLIEFQEKYKIEGTFMVLDIERLLSKTPEDDEKVRQNIKNVRREYGCASDSEIDEDQ